MSAERAGWSGCPTPAVPEFTISVSVKSGGSGGLVPDTALLTLAVVIPVLDEENGLPRAMTSLQHQVSPPNRVFVVDAGSRDRTVAVAREYGANVLVSAARGRGNQTATGVNAATEDVVVVGHADMVFPPDALDRIRRHLLSQPRCPGGCLGHRFASDRWQYRLIEWFDRRRAVTGHSYGDQCQFFRRELLAAVGGYPALPILEDVELSTRLRSLGRPAFLDCPVTVSPRRFERLGVARTLWENWRFRRAYRCGGVAATQAIFDRYYPSRKDSP